MVTTQVANSWENKHWSRGFWIGDDLNILYETWAAGSGHLDNEISVA